MDQPRIPHQTEVLILGGGITGITLASLLARNGKSVLLVEKNDFASGSTQASGMMIWGGLLYLKNLEIGLVRRFCRARDRLIQESGDEVRTRAFTYLVSKNGGRNRMLVWLALQLYQMLAVWKRAPLRSFPLEQLCSTFDKRSFKYGWTYEEGFLESSDSRFALQRLLAGGDAVKALNYCEVVAIRHLPEEEMFVAQLKHGTDGPITEVRARKIVNCGGVWAEEINDRFQMKTEHVHHLSKGVYLLLPAQASQEARIVDMEAHGDALCWVPWGDVVMWGPTETTIDHLDDAMADAADVDFLLGKLNRYSTRRWTRDDVINVRCGVRPLAKKRGRKVDYPLELSRCGVIEKAENRPWWTVFGGKLSGAEDFAVNIYQELYGKKPRRSACQIHPRVVPQVHDYFSGRSLPDPVYCRDIEHCRTLEDYLRRRTNVAQWIPCGGFGRENEFEPDLLAIAGILTRDAITAEQQVLAYRNKTRLERARWNE